METTTSVGALLFSVLRMVFDEFILRLAMDASSFQNEAPLNRGWHMDIDASIPHQIVFYGIAARP